MALRIELNKASLIQALDGAIAACKRGLNTHKRPQFKELYERDLAELQHALNTITEIK